MGTFESLFRSKLTAAELADRLYQTMIADGAMRQQAEQAADEAEWRGRAFAVRKLEEWDATTPTIVTEPVTMIGWYNT